MVRHRLWQGRENLSHAQQLKRIIENSAAMRERYGRVMVEESKQNMPIESAKSR